MRLFLCNNEVKNNFYVVTVIITLFTFAGCSSEDRSTLSYEETDPFVRKVFDAILYEDFDAYIRLCVQPGEIGVSGMALMPESNSKWQQAHKGRFELLISAIKNAGGLSTMDWVRPGQALGYLMDESEFVGNLYAEITLGSKAEKMVLEIEATYNTKARGRLLGEGSDVLLKTWDYYKVNVL